MIGAGIISRNELISASSGIRKLAQAPDQFFQNELENLCGLLNNLGVRVIYELDLCGHGSGLYDVRLYVSFEQHHDKEQIDRLKFTGPRADAMEQLSNSWLISNQTAKKELAEALVREPHGPTRII